MKIKIGDITKIRTGKLDANAADENGQYPFFTCSKEPLKINTYSYDCECVLVAGNGDLNVKYYNGKFDAYQRTYIIEDDSDGLLFMPYLYFFMESYIDELRKQSIGGVIKYIKLKNLTDALIELPSIEVQRKIVNIISKSKEIVRRKENEFELLDELVRARFVEMFGDVQDAKKHSGIQLKDICNTVTGGTPSTKHVEYYNGTIPWISTVSLGPNYIDGTTAKAFITQEAVDNSSTKIIPSDSILFGTRVGVGKSSINQVEMCTNQDIVAIIDLDESKYNKLYIKYVLDTYQSYFDSIKKGATILGISSDDLKNIYVPDASLYEQDRFEKFVKQIDKSRLLSNHSLFLIKSIIF